ncbi:MAG: hypothetical protein PVH22_09535, partial [Desulfobacteraceae bacterium]
MSSVPYLDMLRYRKSIGSHTPSAGIEPKNIAARFSRTAQVSVTQLLANHLYFMVGREIQPP